MNSDIRIPVSFIGHRKRRKLSLALGVPECAGYLLDLWLNAAMNRPKGVLYDMDAADIAIDAGWEGDPEVFVGALVSCGFLDLDNDGVYVLHDWAEHQGYAQFAEERRDQARNAANARWAKHRAAAGNAERIDEQCGEHSPALPTDTGSNAPSPVPSPSPLPVPKDKNICSPANDTAKPSRGKADYSPEFKAFWAVYPRQVVPKKAWKNWNTCLKAGISPGELTSAAAAYAERCRRLRTGEEFILHPATFLGPSEPWKGYVQQAGQAGAPPPGSGVIGRLSPEEEARQLADIEKYIPAGVV
ncbi:MAG: hypothetical protein Q4C86_10620 [bacterium]|nr:hypothetical protein [bacterium]